MNGPRGEDGRSAIRRLVLLRNLARRAPIAVATSLILLAGCRVDEVDTTYGRSRGPSINGTAVVASLIRDRGHEVRVAVRWNDSLASWADTLVRFAPYPGPPDVDEARWLAHWLGAATGRKLVYVPRDFDAATEFFDLLLAEMGPDTPADARNRARARRDAAQPWPRDLPDRPRAVASVDDWFGTTPIDPRQVHEVATARTLAGPWAAGLDADAAALPVHEALKLRNNETVLLEGDGRPLVATWTTSDRDGDPAGRVLVVANAAFLLNAGLLNPARRVLADRVVDWVGAGPEHVALLEGSHVLAEPDEARASPFRLLGVPPFGFVAGHLGAFGLLGCLALAVHLGRPRPEPAGDIERPSAHPIALGATLARTRQVEFARALVADYRRWRQPQTGAPATSRSALPPIPDPSPRRAPRA